MCMSLHRADGGFSLRAHAGEKNPPDPWRVRGLRALQLGEQLVCDALRLLVGEDDVHVLVRESLGGHRPPFPRQRYCRGKGGFG